MADRRPQGKEIMVGTQRILAATAAAAVVAAALGLLGVMAPTAATS
jgi:hypothetical protein